MSPQQNKNVYTYVSESLYKANALLLKELEKNIRELQDGTGNEPTADITIGHSGQHKK